MSSLPNTTTPFGIHSSTSLDRLSSLILSLPRGEHIHHGYFLQPDDTKERAQVRLIELLLDRSKLDKGSAVLDVGSGIGGTSRYLASQHDCKVTGITISRKQVEMATNLTRDMSNHGHTVSPGNSVNLGHGCAQFHEVDAETMGGFFSEKDAFDCIWISEAMSHLPDKLLFFRNAFKLLRSPDEQPRRSGKLVVADWFKAESLTEKQLVDDIKPIEGIFRGPIIVCRVSLSLECRWYAFASSVHSIGLLQIGARGWLQRLL